MKLDKNKNVVEVNGVQKSKKMTIQIDGKAFAMFSDSLYQNKIGSIVREISSNAKDSHRLSKNTEPFQIHLPTYVEPWFSVQDFGVGLTHAEMDSIYSVLLKSTKDQSNDDLGAYGLGSKTPLSKVENFTVTSIKDGIETFYSVFKDAEGIPEVAVMSSNKTDKPSGFTVSIAVDEEDFYEYECEVTDQLKYFSNKPTVVGKPHFRWNDILKPTFTVGNTEFIRYHAYGSNITIIQGEIGYTLSMDSMEKKVSSEDYKKLKTLSHSGARMTFDIGQINVTLSREGLEYDNPTIDAIMTEVRKAVDGIEPHIHTLLDAQDTDWDKAVVLNGNALYRQLASGIDYTIPYCILSTTGHAKFTAKDLFKTKIKEGEDDWGDTLYNTSEHYLLKKYHIPYNADRLVALTSHSRDRLQVCRTITQLFIRDTNKQPLVRLKNYLSDNSLSASGVYVINVGANNYSEPSEVFTDEVISQISVRFGGLKVIRMSEMSLPVRATARAPSMTGKLLRMSTVETSDRYNKSYDISQTTHWNKLTEKLTDMDAGVFIETYNGAVKYDDVNLLGKYINYVETGVAESSIHGFNSATSKRAIKMGTWLTLKQYIAQLDSKADAMMKKCKTVARYEYISDTCNAFFNTDVFDKLFEHISLIESDKATKLITTTLNAEDVFEKKFSKLSGELQNFYKNFGSTISQKFRSDFKEHKDYLAIESAREEFQLLQYVPSRALNDDDGVLHIIQYVNCMGEGA